jgi:hypothetical protein
MKPFRPSASHCATDSQGRACLFLAHQKKSHKDFYAVRPCCGAAVGPAVGPAVGLLSGVLKAMLRQTAALCVKSTVRKQLLYLY